MSQKTVRGDKYKAILDSTLFLVSTYGFHGTSMAMIAEDAGIGAGTIYRYFKSKDDLIFTLHAGDPGKGHPGHVARL